MSKDTDAIVIGAGIIGCCTAFELGKKGYRTLNIDKLPSAGHGSNGNSHAIVRLHYSTFTAAAMAQEGLSTGRTILRSTTRAALLSTATSAASSLRRSATDF